MASKDKYWSEEILITQCMSEERIIKPGSMKRLDTLDTLSLTIELLMMMMIGIYPSW
jgi:hypothetical protein